MEDQLSEFKAAIGTLGKTVGDRLSQTDEKVKQTADTVAGHAVRLLDMEQKQARRPGGGESRQSSDNAGSIVAQLTESAQFKLLASGEAKSARIAVDSKLMVAPRGIKTTILSQDALGVPQRSQEVIGPLHQKLTLRDLLGGATPTTSNAIQYTRRTSYTNSAGPQYAAGTPPTRDGALKNESAMAFDLITAQTTTLAHWIPASKQVLDDAPLLQSYISNELLYGLALEEDKEILNGNGTAGKLNGLIPLATAYSRAVTGDTKIDTIRRAITQVTLVNGTPTGMVLNPVDLEGIELTKSTQGEYIEVIVDVNGKPTIWRVPVAETISIAAGTFLVGDFTHGAELWDRQQATVEVSREHADFFIRNLVAILAEERLALTVYRPDLFVTGTFS